MQHKAGNNVIRFALCMLVNYLVFYGIYMSIPDTLLREKIYFHSLTEPAAHIINVLAPVETVRADKSLLISPRANLEIVRGCDGSGAWILFTAAIVAFPAPYVAKFRGIALGSLAIFGLNLQRIVALYFVEAYRPRWFLPVHVYFAPTLMIVVVTLMFLYYTVQVTSPRT